MTRRGGTPRGSGWGQSNRTPLPAPPPAASAPLMNHFAVFLCERGGRPRFPVINSSSLPCPLPGQCGGVLFGGHAGKQAMYAKRTAPTARPAVPDGSVVGEAAAMAVCLGGAAVTTSRAPAAMDVSAAMSSGAVGGATSGGEGNAEHLLDSCCCCLHISPLLVRPPLPPPRWRCPATASWLR